MYDNEKELAKGNHPDHEANERARNAKTTTVYPKGNQPDKDANGKNQSEEDKLKEEKHRADEVAKAEAEGGHNHGPHKSPLTPEDKKEQEADHEAAVKAEKEEAKKSADAIIEKNPVPKEEKKAAVLAHTNESSEESIQDIDR